MYCLHIVGATLMDEHKFKLSVYEDGPINI